MRTKSIAFGRLFIALLAVLVLAAACSGDDDTASSEAIGIGVDSADDSGFADGDAGDVATDDGGDAMADGQGIVGSDDADEGGLGSGSGAPVNLSARDLGRQIVFTATLAIEVDDVAAAAAEASAIIADVDGFVFGESTVGGSNPSSEITFKVLPERFDEALERLGAVGELRSQSISADDVTERVVDLEGRIEVAELGVDRLRSAMEEATDLEDFARLEELLLNRESSLEVMRGQLRTLRDQIDLATITLILSQDRVENSIDLRVTAYEGHDNAISCPGDDGLRIEKNTDATVCFEVINTGDQILTDFILTDSVLEIDADSELIAVFDTLDELAPGQSAMVAHEFEADRNQRLRTRVVATPTDGVNPGPAGPSVNRTERSFEVRVFEAESDPGFGDGWDAAGNVLSAIWVGLTVAIGFLIPLLVFVPIIGLVVAGWRRYRRSRPPRETDGSRRPPPPPPASS